MDFVDGAESLDGCGGRLEKGGGLLSGFAGNFWVASRRHRFLFSSFALFSSINITKNF